MSIDCSDSSDGGGTKVTNQSEWLVGILRMEDEVNCQCGKNATHKLSTERGGTIRVCGDCYRKLKFPPSLPVNPDKTQSTPLGVLRRKSVPRRRGRR